MVNRRKLRMSLGSRVKRRIGAKNKKAFDKLSPRPRVLLAELIREAERTA